jgi:hypothetical protein
MAFGRHFVDAVIYERQSTTTHPIYFSPDQFERLFRKIVSDAKCEKLVIVVDNLDRCASDLVLETLSGVKTFLEGTAGEKCVFLIPCDDGAIRRQVERARLPDRAWDNSKPLANSKAANHESDYGTEYLRKFFNASIRIDPALDQEIEPYIEAQLARLVVGQDLDQTDRATIVQMVGSTLPGNPRMVKQYLNHLSSKYRPTLKSIPLSAEISRFWQRCPSSRLCSPTYSADSLATTPFMKTSSIS